MTHQPTIGFVGLTHLGLNSALAAASKGFNVVGWDPSEELIQNLESGAIPINEPGFDDLFNTVRDRFHFSSSLEALGECDLVYLSVDVPTGEQGESDLAPVQSLLEQVSGSLGDHTVCVILSQVPPGFTAKMAGKFGALYYQVETLIFGRAVERAINPERFIVGMPDPSEKLPAVFRGFLESFDCPILPMRYESAELCKIAINCFLVASVSTTNALANVCEKIGADWNEIAPALRLDSRIGPQAYLKPGLGISGGNLERDLRNVVEMAGRNGVDAGPIQEYRRFSDITKDWAFDALNAALSGSIIGKTIGVLGLAYKENTHSTKNSPALRLIGRLGDCSLRVYDPVVAGSVAPSADATDNVLECVVGCDAVCIMTPWEEFKSISAKELSARVLGPHIIDPYGLLDSRTLSDAGLQHYVRGRRPT
jgi:UDPglucose 6-dehydrogenase